MPGKPSRPKTWVCLFVTLGCAGKPGRSTWVCLLLGAPVVPFHRFFFREGSPTNIDYRKKGTLILTSLLEDLVFVGGPVWVDCDQQDVQIPNVGIREASAIKRFSTKPTKVERFAEGSTATKFMGGLGFLRSSAWCPYPHPQRCQQRRGALEASHPFLCQGKSNMGVLFLKIS